MPYDFDDMELPIEPLVLEGAAVEAWAARKENNNSAEASTIDFLANYERIKSDLMRNLRTIVESEI